MAKKTTVSRNSRPVGVSIISILGYIGAVITLILGLIALIAAPTVFALLPAIADMPWLSAIGAAVGIILGIILIVLAVIDYLIARGLWKGKNWARIVVIVLAALSLISSLSALPASILTIIIDGVIIWYLGFNSKAKNYFN